jgi:hypothetical protein
MKLLVYLPRCAPKTRQEEAWRGLGAKKPQKHEENEASHYIFALHCFAPSRMMITTRERWKSLEGL